MSARMYHVCGRDIKHVCNQFPFFDIHICIRAAYVVHTWHVCTTYADISNNPYHSEITMVESVPVGLSWCMLGVCAGYILMYSN